MYVSRPIVISSARQEQTPGASCGRQAALTDKTRGREQNTPPPPPPTTTTAMVFGKTTAASHLSQIDVSRREKRRPVAVSNSVAFVSQVPLFARTGVVRHLNKERKETQAPRRTRVKRVAGSVCRFPPRLHETAVASTHNTYISRVSTPDTLWSKLGLHAARKGNRSLHRPPPTALGYRTPRAGFPPLSRSVKYLACMQSREALS